MKHSVVGLFNDEVMLSYSENREIKFCKVSKEQFIQMIDNREIHGFDLAFHDGKRYVAVDFCRYVPLAELLSVLPKLSQFEHDFMIRNMKPDKRNPKWRRKPRAFVGVVYVGEHVTLRVITDSWDAAEAINDSIGRNMYETGEVLVFDGTERCSLIVVRALMRECDVLWDTSFSNKDRIIGYRCEGKAKRFEEYYKECNTETLKRMTTY